MATGETEWCGMKTTRMPRRINGVQSVVFCRQRRRFLAVRRPEEVRAGRVRPIGVSRQAVRHQQVEQPSIRPNGNHSVRPYGKQQLRFPPARRSKLGYVVFHERQQLVPPERLCAVRHLAGHCLPRRGANRLPACGSNRRLGAEPEYGTLTKRHVRSGLRSPLSGRGDRS